MIPVLRLAPPASPYAANGQAGSSSITLIVTGPLVTVSSASVQRGDSELLRPSWPRSCLVHGVIAASPQDLGRAPGRQGPIEIEHRRSQRMHAVVVRLTKASGIYRYRKGISHRSADSVRESIARSRHCVLPCSACAISLVITPSPGPEVFSRRWQGPFRILKELDMIWQGLNPEEFRDTP